MRDVEINQSVLYAPSRCSCAVEEVQHRLIRVYGGGPGGTNQGAEIRARHTETASSKTRKDERI